LAFFLSPSTLIILQYMHFNRGRLHWLLVLLLVLIVRRGWVQPFSLDRIAICLLVELWGSK